MPPLFVAFVFLLRAFAPSREQNYPRMKRKKPTASRGAREFRAFRSAA
jgi:hypothetical protein